MSESSKSLIDFDKKKRKTFGFIIGYWEAELLYRLFRYLDGDFFQIAKKDSDNEYLYLIFFVISDLFSLILLPFDKIIKKKISIQKRF